MSKARRGKEPRCRHFNGFSDEKKTCDAGVNHAAAGVCRYTTEEERKAGRVGLQTYAPLLLITCFGDDGAAPCEKYSTFTEEEVAAQEAEDARHLDCMRRGVSSCCGTPIDKRTVITSGRYKGHGPRYCSTCGKLLFMV
jgi:hypothetical protein